MAPRDLPMDAFDVTFDSEDWSEADAEPFQNSLLYQSLPGAERKAVHDATGRLLAKQQAAALVQNMISGRGLTLSDLNAQTGFAPKVVSQICNERSKDGPLLATLHALADALQYDIEIKLVDRSKE